MARLIAEEGTLKGLILELQENTEWLLGRDPDANQLILQDSKVSRQHALIKRSGDDYTLENLSQTNPISVDGVVVAGPVPLKEGCHFKIGGTTFLFTSKKELPRQEPTLKLTEDRTILDKEPDYDTVFETAGQAKEPQTLDLSLRQRWLLKVIGGPQSGAEFSMEKGRSYIIGSDAALSDIILYDLSVSRKHAKLTVQDNEKCLIEDLGSRNGVVIDGLLITKPTELKGQEVINLGTTSFIIVDREKASETILSTPPEAVTEGVEAPTVEARKKAPIPPLKRFLASRELQLISIALVIVALFAGFGITSLLNVTPVETEERDYHSEIAEALKDYPEVSFSYNKGAGRLFLVGHVLVPADKTKLEYALRNLQFLGIIDDSNVIIDQSIWTQMNTLISQNPDWQGVNLYASRPGSFVVTGYLKTRAEAVKLSDWLNLNFNYLDRLENRITVEEDLNAEIASQLIAQSFNGVSLDVSNGEVTLTGFIPQDRSQDFKDLVQKFNSTPGVRSVKSFVAELTPTEAVVDLSSRYRVTGFSTRDNTSVNVVINGQILGRGDQIDGMTITSIQPGTIFLEKNGLKFKIQYNP